MVVPDATLAKLGSVNKPFAVMANVLAPSAMALLAVTLALTPSATPLLIFSMLAGMATDDLPPMATLFDPIGPTIIPRAPISVLLLPPPTLASYPTATHSLL